MQVLYIVRIVPTVRLSTVEVIFDRAKLNFFSGTIWEIEYSLGGGCIRLPNFYAPHMPAFSLFPRWRTVNIEWDFRLHTSTGTRTGTVQMYRT